MWFSQDYTIDTFKVNFDIILEMERCVWNCIACVKIFTSEREFQFSDCIIPNEQESSNK